MERHVAVARLASLVALGLLQLLPRTGLSAEAADTPAGISVPGKNFVRNGDFSQPIGTAWRFFHEPTAGRCHGLVAEGPDGSACLKLSGRFDESLYLQQTFMPEATSLEPGQTYTLSVSFKAEDLTGIDPSKLLFFIDYGWHSASIPIGVSAPTTNGWERRSVTFAAPPTHYPPDSYKYALMLYWPIGSSGTLWMDDVQIEAGPEATAFTARHNDTARLEAHEVRRLAALATRMKKGLAENFAALPLAALLLARLEAAASCLPPLAEDLRRYSELPPERVTALATQIAAVGADLGQLTCLVWYQNPYLPATEKDLPSALTAPEPRTLVCWVNETRHLAVMLTNLGDHSLDWRVAPQRFRRAADGVEVDGKGFIAVHEAPLLRGQLHPDRLYTDPLPRCNEMNGVCVPAAETRQVVLVLSTCALDPGTYEGTILLDALKDREALGRTLRLSLQVLPVCLPRQVPVAVCPLGARNLRADEALRLGHNLMPLDGGAVPIRLDERGELRGSEDFGSLDRQIADCRAVVPDCRFVLLFSLGPRFVTLTGQLYGYAWPEPRLKRAWQNWIQALFTHVQALGVDLDEIYLQVVDEPQDSRIEMMAELSRLAKEAVPGLRTMTYGGDPARHAALFKALDLACPTSRDLAQPGLLERIRAAGVEPGLYDCNEYNEIIHPLVYRRLMPWQVWEHGLSGWHYWSRDDRHPNWSAVKFMSVLYPLAEAEFGRNLTPDIGCVISRHWLALEAGYQDYKALYALRQAANAARAAGRNAEAVAAADQFLATAPGQALALLDPATFPNALAATADPNTPDRLREQMAGLTARLIAGAGVQVTSGPTLNRKGRLRLETGQPCTLRIEYVVDGRLPRREAAVTVARLDHEVDLDRDGGREFSRCHVTVLAENGSVLTCSPFIEPTVSVDSTNPGYETSCLTDGIRYPGALFWPGQTWISGGDAVEHWVRLDWGEPRRVRECAISWMTRGGRPEAFKLQRLTAAGAWEDLEEWHPARADAETVSFLAVTTRALRLLQKAGGGGVHTPNLLGVSELEVR